MTETASRCQSEISMHRAILCIGSNVKAACELIDRAVNRLSENGVNVTAKSKIYSVSQPYYNCVADISTDACLGALLSLTKSLEKEMGRTAAMKALSIVPIDIDVVIFDGETLRPADYSSDYFMLGFSLISN